MGILLVTEKHSCKWLRVEELPCMTMAISFTMHAEGIDSGTADNGLFLAALAPLLQM